MGENKKLAILKEKLSEEQEKGHRERLRQRFLSTGTKGFLDYELLELLLTYTVIRKNCRGIAKNLLKKYGDLYTILQQSEEELQKNKYMTERTVVFLKLLSEIIENGLYKKIHNKKISITSNIKLLNYLKCSLLKRDIEVFKVLFLNTQNELEYRKKAYEHYRVELDKLKKSYELGASPKINLESVELEAEDSKLQIDILETKLKSLYDVGKTDYNIDFENYKLLDFVENNESIDFILNSYMKDEVEELRLSLSMAEERKSYSNYDRYMPDLYLGYERVDRNLRGDRYYRDQDLFTIKFSKKLFSTDSEYKLNELEVENLKNDLNEKIRVINAEKIKLKSEYHELLKLASIGDKKSNIAYKKYLIKEKEYELNKSSYLDVIDEYNKYLSQEIETKKAKNALNAFVYKIKIKR